jgi:tetratricopeptide (TPR) repeat protein
VGDYEKAAEASENALQADKRYVVNCQNISNKNCIQLYTGHYNSHNLLFLAVSYAMTGQSNKALKQADKIEKFVPQYLNNQHRLAHYLPTKILMLERFAMWDKILNLNPEPKFEEKVSNALWYWTKAMAYLGKKDLQKGKTARNEFIKIFNSIEPKLSWRKNKARDVLTISYLVLDAKIAAFENKADQAIQLLKTAVNKQDKLVYDEPIPWTPVREALGAALYENKHYSEAEQVFRKDIESTDRRANPLNARSLFGLYKSLEAQAGKTKQAKYIKNKFDTAWQKADIKLEMSDLF